MMGEQFWRNIPKTFCDNAAMAVAGGLGDTFHLALFSGGNTQAFTFTPEHMKRVSQLIAHHLKEYENAHGQISVEPWENNTKSPFQYKDIRGDK